MAQKTTVSIRRTFVNWLAVVVAGSLICTFFSAGFSPAIFLVFAVMSAVCSLPALTIFIFVNSALNKRNISPRRYSLKQGLVHFGASVLTFLVLILLMDLDDSDFLLPVAAVYTIAGQVVWWFTLNPVRPAEKQLLDNSSNQQP